TNRLNSSTVLSGSVSTEKVCPVWHLMFSLMVFLFSDVGALFKSSPIFSFLYKAFQNACCFCCSLRLKTWPANVFVVCAWTEGMGEIWGGIRCNSNSVNLRE